MSPIVATPRFAALPLTALALAAFLLTGCQRSDSPAQEATPAADAPANAATPAPATAPDTTAAPDTAAAPNGSEANESGADESQARERRVAAEGEMCGGFAGIACQEGLQCAMEAGRCNVADDAGTCRRAPDVCTQQYQPVCGCDGKTYGNACTAAQSGVKVDKSGECG